MVLGSLACASYLFFFVLLGVLYKVTRVFKCSNVGVLRMLFFLSLAVLFKAIHFTAKTHSIAVSIAGGPDSSHSDSSLAVLAGLPVLFFQAAVILNLSNWVFYYVKIGELAQLAQGNTPAFSVERSKCVIDAVAFLFIATVLYIEIDETVLILNKQESGMSNTLLGLTRAGCIFIALGILFGLLGIMTLCTMKVHFKKFY